MILLGCLLLSTFAYLIFLFKEIVVINEQMTFILSNETNAEITTTSKHKIIKNHVSKCNQLIQQNKQIKIQHGNVNVEKKITKTQASASTAVSRSPTDAFLRRL